MDQYPQDDKSILPTLIRIIRDDPNLAVVYKTAMRFNGLTKQTFEFRKTNEIIAWWDKNQKAFQP